MRGRKQNALPAPIGRRQFMQMCAGSLALAAAGCRRGGDPAYRRGSTVVVAARTERDVLPDMCDLDFLFFLPLAKSNDRGELEGRLARSWEHSPDHREYTYHLRTDVRWDDGVPVTAHDVKFTLDLLGHPDVAEYKGFGSTVVDDSTVRIRADKPYYIDDITYFPRHLLEGLDPKRIWQWDFWTHPVGNGPYRFVRYVPGTLMELEANPYYYAGKPRIGRVFLKFVGDAGLTELLAGNTDIVLVGDPVQIPRLAKDPKFRVYSQVGTGGRAVYWKCDHPLFRDPRVRRALTLAIDRVELRRLVNLPPEAPITDGIMTQRQLRRGEILEPLAYDPGQARRLLEAAGWVDRDGFRERDGRPFRFTASVWSGHGMPQLAVLVQDYLRRIGVRMDMVVLDEPLMFKKLRAGDFEAALMVQQPGSGAQQRDFGRGNHTGYESPEAFRVIDRLMATADPDEEDRLYRQFATILQRDMPITRLLPWSEVSFAHRRVRGLSTPFRATPDTYMGELWLEDGGDQ